MALEIATTINELVSTNPAGTDDTSRGDDHIRLLKSVLKATFPAIAGAVTASHAQLNQLGTIISSLATAVQRDGAVAMTGALNMGSQRITALATPTANTDATTKKYVDDLVSAAVAAVEEQRQRLYPVGSRIILGGVDTPPSTLLGFGTWSLVSKDRVMIGAGATYARGATGGAAEITLEGGQLPAHKHTLFADEIVGETAGDLGSPTQQVPRFFDIEGNNEQYRLKQTTREATVGLSGTSGASAPIPILPPYEAVNIWQRTA